MRGIAIIYASWREFNNPRVLCAAGLKSGSDSCEAAVTLR
jgi:hypothetical protein